MVNLEKIKKENKKINAILQFNPDFEKELKSSKGKLKGKVIAVKANINVKGLNASCASKTLSNYVSPYDATVVKKIKDAGGVILGMANMDEFAQGSSGETSAFGPTENPAAPGKITGGTSSGCAAALAADFCDMALGTDTGGSSRNPASHCGVVGVKPTYGTVSRYGLIDSAMSFDQIAPMAKNVKDARLLLEVIRGKDECDSVSKEGKVVNKKGKLVVGVLDLSGLKVDSRITDLITGKINEVAKKNNWTLKNVKIPHLDLAIETYYPIQYVEFFSGTRRFDGRRYGKKIEDVAGPEVIRRILGGSEISKAEHAGRYYYLALKAKKLMEDEFSKAFKQVDCIVMPTVPKLPHKIGSKISVEEMYAYDVLTVPANLTGCPAVSVPCGKVSGIPVGIQIMCDKFNDDLMLDVADRVQ